jgi:hypothetical protein
MNFELIKTQLIEWLTSFVEKPNPALNNWPPCPYARQARINNKILIVDSTIENLTKTVNESLTVFDQYDVAVVCFDHTLISGQDCQQLSQELNDKLMPLNFVLLEDHPNLVEYVAGVKMNFGPCGLFVISPLTALNAASDQLRSKGYYDTWNQSELDEVVTWRYNS